MIKKAILGFVFMFLIFANDGFSAGEIFGIDSNKLKSALEYSLCEILYWDDGATNLNNNCEEMYSGLYANIGKKIGANVYCDISGLKSPKWFCVEVPEIQKDRALTFNLALMKKRILYSEYDETSCSKSTGMKQVAKDIIVMIPKDWHERILSLRVKVVGQEKIKLQDAIKNIFFGKKGAKLDRHGRQHFFIGPFTPTDTNMYAYWVEEKKYWVLPISPVVFEAEGDQDYNLASPYTLWKPVDAIYDGGDVSDIRCRRAQIDIVIANCLRDGDLIEVDLP